MNWSSIIIISPSWQVWLDWIAFHSRRFVTLVCVCVSLLFKWRHDEAFKLLDLEGEEEGFEGPSNQATCSPISISHTKEQETDGFLYVGRFCCCCWRDVVMVPFFSLWESFLFSHLLLILVPHERRSRMRGEMRQARRIVHLTHSPGWGMDADSMHR